MAESRRFVEFDGWQVRQKARHVRPSLRLLTNWEVTNLALSRARTCGDCLELTAALAAVFHGKSTKR